METPRHWEFLIQATVGDDTYVRLPPRVKDAVAIDHPLKGPSVCWNINQESGHLVLSERGLQKEQYLDAGRYKIYDIESVGDDGGRIRPPGDLNDIWPVDPQRGDRVFFLAHSAMQTNTVASVFLLTEPQLLTLLPKRPGSHRNNAGPTTDGVFEIPGFTESN